MLRSSSATASAASPSPRPVKPSRSVVVARTLTRSGSTPSAPARRLRISSRWPAIRGSSPIRTQSAFTSAKPGLADLRVGVAQQVERVGALPALVAGGEERADVAEPRRAEHGVDEGVRDHVAVRVAGEAARVLDRDPAEHERHAVLERVRVDARARRGAQTPSTSGSSSERVDRAARPAAARAGAPTGRGGCARRPSPPRAPARRRCRRGRRRTRSRRRRHRTRRRSARRTPAPASRLPSGPTSRRRSTCSRSRLLGVRERVADGADAQPRLAERRQARQRVGVEVVRPPGRRGCSTPRISQTRRWCSPRAARPPTTPISVKRGAPAASAARSHSRVSSISVSPTSKTTAFTATTSTSSRSALVVTFSSRGSPSTHLTRPPRASTSDAQSVAPARSPA